jgi:hypothetical protein
VRYRGAPDRGGHGPALLDRPHRDYGLCLGYICSVCHVTADILGVLATASWLSLLGALPRDRRKQ